MTRHRTLAAACASLSVAGLLHGQTTAPSAPVVTSWTPYLGCWSSSSAGVVGPMVCIVPTDSRDRAEVMSVVGDSVVSRMIVDASGTRVRQTTGNCDGWESARWSADGERLLMHAEYTCGGKDKLRSDAIMAMTQPDAFTRVERVTNRGGVPARTVNFIVQLDTTAFPIEVRRRLPYLRPLASDISELETLPKLPTAAVVEAANELDETVVSAWLVDRGLAAEMAPVLRIVSLAERGERLNMVWSPRARDVLSRGASLRAFGVVTPLTADRGILWSELPFGVPYPGYQGGFPWAGWP